MTRLKKTLVLTENFPPISGGSGRWFWELYSRLPRDEYLIVADHHEGAETFDKTHDLDIIRMPLKSPEWGLKSKQGLSYYWRTFWALKKIIKQNQITHIHCGRVIHEGVTAWLLSLFSKVNYLCFVHGEDVETAATSREHDLMVRQVCNRAEMILCNSLNSEAIVKRLNYAPADKIQVLHPGCDTQRFKPAAPDAEFRAQMGWTDRLVIITVGRLQRRKGQDYFIKSMPQILEKVPNALYCVIGGGELAEELAASVSKQGLNQYVQLRTDLSDQQLIQCYQQCDLFILPNRTIDNDIEGFGMVLVEAQACAKPVMAGDSGGTTETMRVGESGYIIDCTSIDNIAEKVSSALADPEQLQQVGQIGRQHVVDQLNWAPLTEKAKALFAEK